ncbi:MAG TPA: hypothetical protein VMM78_18855, partial [Thermomicrobiales bacterium]|nr:hypothetical protein [Thermomicrobiales bacterium]
IDVLRRQVRDQHLDRFERVIGLGGKEYRDALMSTFKGVDVKLVFPFAGLPLGKMMRATKQALSGGPPPDR